MMYLRMLAIVFGATAGLTALHTTVMSAEPAHPHGEHFASCAKACADCQLQCDMCFHHCADLLAKGNKEHAKTMNSCVDCADCCALAAKLTARHSMFSVAACECCAKCCDECAAACEMFKDDKHMADCAKSCRECSKACRAMVQHLKH